VLEIWNKEPSVAINALESLEILLKSKPEVVKQAKDVQLPKILQNIANTTRSSVIKIKANECLIL